MRMKKKKILKFQKNNLDSTKKEELEIISQIFEY